MAVKENRPSLCEGTGDALLDTDRERFAARFGGYAEQSDTGHGRVERRRCQVSGEPALTEPFSGDWKGLASVVAIEGAENLSVLPAPIGLGSGRERVPMASTGRVSVPTPAGLVARRCSFGR